MSLLSDLPPGGAPLGLSTHAAGLLRTIRAGHRCRRPAQGHRRAVLAELLQLDATVKGP